MPGCLFEADFRVDLDDVELVCVGCHDELVDENRFDDGRRSVDEVVRALLDLGVEELDRYRPGPLALVAASAALNEPLARVRAAALDLVGVEAAVLNRDLLWVLRVELPRGNVAAPPPALAPARPSTPPKGRGLTAEQRGALVLRPASPWQDRRARSVTVLRHLEGRFAGALLAELRAVDPEGAQGLALESLLDSLTTQKLVARFPALPSDPPRAKRRYAITTRGRAQRVTWQNELEIEREVGA